LNIIHVSVLKLVGITEVFSELVINFFAIVSTLIEEHIILIENIYNMDEIDMPIYYFIDSNRIYSQQKLNQLCCCQFSSLSKVSSITTMIEYIYANRLSIPPMRIFKGKGLMTSWISSNDWQYIYNIKG